MLQPSDHRDGAWIATKGLNNFNSPRVGVGSGMDLRTMTLYVDLVVVDTNARGFPLIEYVGVCHTQQRLIVG